MNNMQSEITEYITARIQSRTTNFNAQIKFLIAKQITLPLPHDAINLQALKLPKNIPLADPSFHKPTTVDGLLGAQLFWHLLSVCQIKLAQPTVMLRKTLLGWLDVGETTSHKNSKAAVCNLAINSLDEQLARFWELEETPREKLLSKEEQACQEHYSINTRRDSASGRYIVRLPCNSKIEQFGESYATAMKRFLSLEKALQRNPVAREQYISFMCEYESLRHMTPLKFCSKFNGYYLPHHAVHKEDSVTSKIRVVFDASAKSSTDVSLNDALMIGPTI
ncbi:uncharacterized protein LOC122404024 [Colletes gigas]|uniref:uncharacterized protein LOC122404024 n=1 Tax=Colletes gigas TaxID=935657 RepID=UPI001C9A9724|nr:uncharacterized protein LOC122404024 [Colletes gigas]